MTELLNNIVEKFAARLGLMAIPAAAPRNGNVSTPGDPIRFIDFPVKGYHLDVSVNAEQVVAASEVLEQTGFSIDTVTGVDWLAEGMLEIVYDYFHPLHGLRIVVRTRLPRDGAEVATISGVFPGANWHERETHDFFGVRFLGHPDLSPLLLPEDATYHPLRKDFVP